MMIYIWKHLFLKQRTIWQMYFILIVPLLCSPELPSKPGHIASFGGVLKKQGTVEECKLFLLHHWSIIEPFF